MTVPHDPTTDRETARWSSCPSWPRRWCWAADPPGETLGEWLEAEGKTVDDVAAASGLPASAVQGILDAAVRLTPQTASQLSRATGISGQFWLNLQHFYNKTNSRTGSLLLAVRRMFYSTVYAVGDLVRRRDRR